jgi:hypothetical protein
VGYSLVIVVVILFYFILTQFYFLFIAKTALLKFCPYFFINVHEIFDFMTKIHITHIIRTEQHFGMNKFFKNKTNSTIFAKTKKLKTFSERICKHLENYNARTEFINP